MATFASNVSAATGISLMRWYADDAPAITRVVHDLVVDAGGSIFVKHGIDQMKRDELARLSSPARMAALRAVETAFDLSGILNSAKLLARALVG